MLHEMTFNTCFQRGFSEFRSYNSGRQAVLDIFYSVPMI